MISYLFVVLLVVADWNENEGGRRRFRPENRYEFRENRKLLIHTKSIDHIFIL